MTMQTGPTATVRRHIALHLARRWFAYFEATGGDPDAHLLMFEPAGTPAA